MTDLEWKQALSQFRRTLDRLTKDRPPGELLALKRALQKRYREKYKRVFIDSYVVPAHTKRIPVRRKVH